MSISADARSAAESFVAWSAAESLTVTKLTKLTCYDMTSSSESGENKSVDELCRIHSASNRPGVFNSTLVTSRVNDIASGAKWFGGGLTKFIRGWDEVNSGARGEVN